MQKKVVLSLVALLLLSVCLFSCGDAADIMETEHQHEYHLDDTVFGTCKAPGHQVFACACGESFQSVIPVPHVFETVTDSSNSYSKEICTVCGVYTITYMRQYLYNIDFENVEGYEAAATQKNCSFYRAGGRGKEPLRLELVEDMGDMSIKSTNSNYYILDQSGVVKGGEDFVTSMDVRFVTHGKASIFTILCNFEGASNFSYNGGLVFVEADGRLSTVKEGDPRYFKDVFLSKEGYDNITVKGNLKTGLYDVYLNEELVRKDVPYVSAGAPIKFVCLRYFDVQNADSYTGYMDNLKLYQASVPEFVDDGEK